MASTQTTAQKAHATKPANPALIPQINVVTFALLDTSTQSATQPLDHPAINATNHAKPVCPLLAQALWLLPVQMDAWHVLLDGLTLQITQQHPQLVRNAPLLVSLVENNLISARLAREDNTPPMNSKEATVWIYQDQLLKLFLLSVH